MSSQINYKPTTGGIDTGEYDVRDRDGWRKDSVVRAGIEDLAALAHSSCWEDRVRAAVLLDRIEVTLPDQFPCLYEPAESPRRSGALRSQPFVWVASPDIDMLRALLPDYQELWDSYNAQWGPNSQQTFVVGRLDGVSPRGVYRPGATPEQVIGSTMLTHGDLYGRAPERLRRMHPMYEKWQAWKAS